MSAIVFLTPSRLQIRILLNRREGKELSFKLFEHYCFGIPFLWKKNPLGLFALKIYIVYGEAWDDVNRLLMDQAGNCPFGYIPLTLRRCVLNDISRALGFPFFRVPRRRRARSGICKHQHAEGKCLRLFRTVRFLHWSCPTESTSRPTNQENSTAMFVFDHPSLIYIFSISVSRGME